MLKTRIITALIIFPATIAVVFLPPSWVFRLLVAGILLIGCWEFRRLADLPALPGWILLALQTLIIALMMSYWNVVRSEPMILLGSGCLAWLLMFTRLFGFREGATPGINFRRAGFLSALAAVTFCWFSLSWLHELPDGPFIVFLLLLIIWASDVGAYFSGRQFGKHKLAPVISPKKTREGVYGGMVLAIAATFLWSVAIARLNISFTALLVMSALTTLASVAGDLFVSIHKRTVDLKDTGTIFPGHGGVLDRYDSLLAGAPFFALAYGVLAQ